MTSLISRVTMPYRKPINPRKASPGLVIGAFALVMTACVLAASALNLMHERDAELQRGRIDIQNLAHSLAENAAHTIQAPDIAMTGMMDLLRYQNPLPERFNKHLSDIVAVLPQVREMGVLNVDGGWRYWSVQQTPAHNNADRPYFAFARPAAAEMKDYRASIDKLRKEAAEAALIRDLATNATKRDMYDMLHRHLNRLADEVERAMNLQGEKSS